MCGFYLMKKYTFAARAFIFTAIVAFVISVFGLTISVLKGCEMRGENSEIDLVDVSLFTYKKMAKKYHDRYLYFCCHWLCFVSVQHDTKVVSITIKPNLDTPATVRYVAILMIFNVKQRLSLTSLAVSCLRTIKIKISFDAKNQLVLLRRRGEKRQ